MKKTLNSLLKANRKNDRTPNNFFADTSLLCFDEPRTFCKRISEKNMSH